MEKSIYKDPRYTTVYFLLKENAIGSFSELFDLIPFTLVARDIHIGTKKMKELVAGEFYDKGLIREIADLIGCEQEKILELALKQYEEKQLKN